MSGEQHDRDLRGVASDIFRCEVLAATLVGERTPCREVVSWQGLRPDGPRYVPEPWIGHLGSAPILFVSSNPSAGERGEPLDPRRQLSSACGDEELFVAADSAFDPGPWPGVVDGSYNRDLDGRRVGRSVRFWAWSRNIARELLGHEPAPGLDYALTEVVHCGSRGEHGVSSALEVCSGRYLRRIVELSAARVIVVVGRIALGAFQDRFALQLDHGFWGPDELAGRQRCVVWLYHPNARRPEKKDLASNLGPDCTAIARSLLRAMVPRKD